MYKTLYRRFINVENKRRQIVAALVAMLIMCYFLTGYSSILYLLVGHFIVRLYLHPLFSPIELTVTGILHLLNVKKHRPETSDKEFASHLALTIVSSSILLELLEYSTLAYTLLFLLSIWKILEATRNVCFGCRVYELILKKGVQVVSL